MTPRRPSLHAFHLACPLTSLPLCRCRLYRRAPPTYVLRARLGLSDATRPTDREATRQRLLRALIAPSTGTISAELAHALHARHTRRPCARRVLAALTDPAEVSRDEAALLSRIEVAEEADAAREAEARREREREREREAAERREREEAAAAAAAEEHMETGAMEEEAAPEKSRRERDRERSRMRKRERDRERNRRRRLQREAEREERERERELALERDGAQVERSRERSRESNRRRR